MLNCVQVLVKKLYFSDLSQTKEVGKVKNMDLLSIKIVKLKKGVANTKTVFVSAKAVVHKSLVVQDKAFMHYKFGTNKNSFAIITPLKKPRQF